MVQARTEVHALGGLEMTHRTCDFIWHCWVRWMGVGAIDSARADAFAELVLHQYL